MKEHRSKALRVTTPHLIESDEFDNKYLRCNHKDADHELFEIGMLQFDLVSSRSNIDGGSDNSGSSSSLSNDFYSLHQHEQGRLRQQYAYDATDSSSSSFHSSLPSPATQYRIASTDDATKFSTAIATTTSSCHLTSIKRDVIRRSLHKFQNGDVRSYESKHRYKGPEEYENKEDGRGEEEGEGGRKCNGEKIFKLVDRFRQHGVLFTNVDKENLLEKCETCHIRYNGCNRRILVNLRGECERNVSLFASASSSSTSISFSRDHRSFSILDLVSGVDLSHNWPLKIKRIKEAISRENKIPARRKSCGPWYDLRDANGNTALLVSGQSLLKEGCFDKAVELATIFLAEGSDVNVLNYENRTLLSYSIQCMDQSIRLTTLLINYGANVWPMVGCVELPLRENRFSDNCSLANETETCVNVANNECRSGNNNGDGGNCNSAFTWFLISIIKRLKLTDHCLQTLYLLAEVMGERPDLMRSHVMNTMFSHAKCYNILGPVFLQIKLAMSPYWTQPPSLKYLCKSAIRRSIFSTPGRFITSENVNATMLPPSLQSYIRLENYS